MRRSVPLRLRRRPRDPRAGGWHAWRDWPRALPYLRPYWKLALVAVALTALGVVIGLAHPWPLAVLLDSVLLRKKERPAILEWLVGDSRTGAIAVVAGATLALTLLGNLLTVLTEYVTTRLELRMVLDFRSDLFRHAQRLSLAFHDEHASGEFMGRINYAAAALGAVVVAIPPLGQALFTLVGMFLITWEIDRQIALLALTVVPFLYYAVGVYGRRIVPHLRRVQGLEWQSLSIVLEAMSMLRVIVAFGRQDHEYRRFRGQGETAVEQRVALTVRQTAFSLAVNTLTAAGTALVLGVGALHYVDGRLSIGDITVILSYVAAMYAPLEQISSAMGHLQEQFVQLRLSLELLEEPVEVDDAPDAVSLGRARGDVELEDVHFSYKGRVDTIAGVSFAVAAGERVGVVGPTGAGKTTLMALLMRFFDPQQGTVRIDRVDLQQVKLESLREQVSVVLQEPLLFSGTIMENIRYGRLDATDEEVVEAAKAANAHDFVSSLPDGYLTELGERGAQLSGGERQRLSVARAFVKDAPILVLDEPTSSIDSKTEAVILEALERLMQGRTTFMIAHRLATIRHADRILVLNRGRLVEQGSHDELVAAGGLYRQMVELQLGLRRLGDIEDEEAARLAEAELVREERRLLAPAAPAPPAPAAGAPAAEEPEPEELERSLARVRLAGGRSAESWLAAAAWTLLGGLRELLDEGRADTLRDLSLRADDPLAEHRVVAQLALAVLRDLDLDLDGDERRAVRLDAEQAHALEELVAAVGGQA